MVFSKAFWKSLWAALAARPAAALLGGNMLLFTNDVDPSPDTAVGDLVEPTWASYVRQAVVITGPFTTGGSHPYVHIGDLNWELIGGDVGETVYGIGIVDGGGFLIVSGRFAVPQILSAVGDAIITSGDPKLIDYPDVGPVIVES